MTVGTPYRYCALIGLAFVVMVTKPALSALEAQELRIVERATDSGTVHIVKDGSQLALGSEPAGGVRVLVSRPARRWRLETGDVLLASGATRFLGPEDFLGLLRRAKPGDSIDLTICRQGRLMTIAIPVSAYQPVLPPAPPAPPRPGDTG